MKLEPSVLNMDWQEVEAKITCFIEDYVLKAKAKGVVLGLSGGIDSCTVAALSAKALGGSKVLALMLPEQETYKAMNQTHAKLAIREFRLESRLCDITGTLESFYKSIPDFNPYDGICKGNIKARTRMIYWYYCANRLNMIVCGSSDKSEAMLGYFTKWGDVAADIYPIMDLYKTQVKKLAKHIGVPSRIIVKPSSPDLWLGQTAESELGMKYEILDLILYGLEHFLTTEEIANQLRLERRIVNKVKQRWLAAEHKRRMLLTTKLGYRTIGADFRIKRG